MDLEHGPGLKLIHDLALGLVQQTRAKGGPDFTLRQLSIDPVGQGGTHAMQKLQTSALTT
jgi:hypothetical protein